MTDNDFRYKLRMSLEKHKGDQMSADYKQRYLDIMSKFENLDIKSIFVAYSVVNKFVKTRLHSKNDIILNTTFFEDCQSDKIAFSIEYSDEIIYVGSENASIVAKKFKELINN